MARRNLIQILKVTEKTTYRFNNVIVANVSRSLCIKNSVMFIDAVGFLPVADNLNVLGSVGLGMLKTKAEAVYSRSYLGVSFYAKETEKKKKTAIRAGLGLEYNFDPVAVRAMVRYNSCSGKKSIVKSITTVGIGAVVTVM